MKDAVKRKASRRPSISDIDDGGEAVMRATAPIDSERPKMRSTRVSILDLGRA